MNPERRSLCLGLEAIGLLGALLIASLMIFGCSGAGVVDKRLSNPIVSTAPGTIIAENAKPGTTTWQISDAALNNEIEGFASLTSVNRGEDINIFVNTTDPTYVMELFRMGWYGGAGGRAVTDPIIRTGTKQPTPSPDPTTHLVECQWNDPYQLHIPNSSDPTDWASGVYLVKLTGGASGKQNYIIFVVRDDARSSDLLFQSSVTTFEAYNNWGGWSLYTQPRAYMVSFDRPYVGNEGAGDFFYFEYSMVRFLEREGYDVTYSTDVDTHARGPLVLFHRGFLSVGHDEYWSWEMRNHLETARGIGESLGFFGANTAYFQIRFQTSSLARAPDRTIVCYKSVSLDPLGSDKDPEVRRHTTTQFRLDPVNRPEDALVGVMYQSFFYDLQDMVIADASSWVFEGTGLRNGDHLPGLLGYESDQMFGHAPPSTKVIANSPYTDIRGRNYNSDMTVYTTAEGSSVVATGSMRWNWGLDDFGQHPVLTNTAVQQATRNILKKFGATSHTEIAHPGGI
jgi:hypothetical protein